MQARELAKYSIIFFINMAEKLDRYQVRIPNLLVEVNSFQLSFAQTGIMIDDVLTITPKGITAKKTGYDLNSIITLSMKTEEKKIRLIRECKRIRNDVFFISNTLADMRRTLAVGDDLASGYITLSMLHSDSHSDIQKLFRQLSNTLGEMENVNHLMLRKIDLLEEALARFSPNVDRKIRRIASTGRQQKFK
jgi:hypothetical protein